MTAKISLASAVLVYDLFPFRFNLNILGLDQQMVQQRSNMK